MRSRALAALLLAFLAVLVAAPAHAEPLPDAMPAPTVTAPVYPAEGEKRIKFQVEGLTADFGLRSVAKEMDADLEEVRVFTTGDCATRPTAICVRVHVGSWDSEAQAAITGGVSGWYAVVIYPSSTLREVYVNTLYPHPNMRAVVAHEFAHVLGLGHHARPGVVGASKDATVLSYSEKRALRLSYRAMLSLVQMWNRGGSPGPSMIVEMR
jgi:hypothetical protein